MTTDRTAEPPAAVPLFDLEALVVAVRRRRRVWSATALLGLLAGAGVAVLLPEPPTAVATVLVAHEGDQPSDPGTLIRTDAALLHTARIAGRALRDLGSTERPEDFLEDYRATGLTNNLLRIEVEGDSDAEAVARAGALAEVFVADHVKRLRDAAEAEAEALRGRRDDLRDELADVNEEIGKAPAQGDPEEAARLESLFARRAELTSRISEVDQRAEEASLGTPRLVAGTQIVDAARPVDRSLPETAAANAGIGLAVGLGLGLALAAVGAVAADRPVLRRDVTAHLGASVVAELPRRTAGPWGRRRERVARKRLTATLARTVRGSAEPVSLLELGCARRTGRIALDLAGALAAQGPVKVVDGLPGGQLSRRRPQRGGPAVVGAADAGPAPSGEFRIGVGSVAPGTAWTDLRHLGGRAVLVVRAGQARTAWLHTVARQLADQGIAVLGVVLVDADPRDRTDGTVWDGPYTALRGKSGRTVPWNGGRRSPTWAAAAPDGNREVR